MGLGVQQPILGVMALLKGKDVALGTSLIMFLQVMSGTIMVSVGQNLFEQHLSSNLAASAPGVNVQVVLSAGNKDLAEKMGQTYNVAQVKNILVAYNQSIDYVFILALALSCLSIVGSVGMEWRNINKEQDSGDEDHASEQDLG